MYVYAVIPTINTIIVKTGIACIYRVGHAFICTSNNYRISAVISRISLRLNYKLYHTMPYGYCLLHVFDSKVYIIAIGRGCLGMRITTYHTYMARCYLYMRDVVCRSWPVC